MGWEKYLMAALMLTCFALHSACKKEAAPEESASPAAADLQSLVGEYKQEHPDLPGISAVIISNGKTYTGAAGMADVLGREPMTADHNVGVASNTKMFTATIVLQLMEEGKLSLHDPLF